MLQHFFLIRADASGILDYILRDERCNFLQEEFVGCRQGGRYANLTLDKFSAWVKRHYLAYEVESGDEDLRIYRIPYQPEVKS